MNSVAIASPELVKRFSKLPKWQQELIHEDMETAFENRIRVMERINNHGI